MVNWGGKIHTEPGCPISWAGWACVRVKKATQWKRWESRLEYTHLFSLLMAGYDLTVRVPTSIFLSWWTATWNCKQKKPLSCPIRHSKRWAMLPPLKKKQFWQYTATQLPAPLLALGAIIKQPEDYSAAVFWYATAELTNPTAMKYRSAAQCVHMLDKETIHVQGRKEWDEARFLSRYSEWYKIQNLWIIYSWNLPFHVCERKMTVGNCWNYR